jgi:hypothetical protein
MSDESQEVASFRMLISSYRNGINKAEGDIATCDMRLAALRLEIAGIEQEKSGHVAVRSKKIALLEGVKQMVRSVEDHEASVRRATEDEHDPK